MNFLTPLIAIALLGSTTISSQAQGSFQEEFNRLSPQEQKAIRAEAVKKEDYDQMPKSPSHLNDESVTAFSKLLPRGLETMMPVKIAEQGASISEKERTRLWARYLSCQDSVLYYEGHRFFSSGHYTGPQIASAVTEIKKVMAWLVKQEEALDAKQQKFTTID